MTRPARLALPVTLALLLTCSTACTRTVQVPVVVPAPACPLPPMPPFPRVSASACAEHVCLTPGDATAIWLWARDTRRWMDLAQVCLAAR
jgi:hypothetical protein